MQKVFSSSTWQVSDKEEWPIKVWKCQGVREVFSATPPVWFGLRMGCGCAAAPSVAMATSDYGRQRGPEGPALSLASQTPASLRIDSIHASIEAEQKWVSPHVEEKLESRLTSLTLPGGGREKTISSWINTIRDYHYYTERSKVSVTFLWANHVSLGKLNLKSCGDAEEICFDCSKRL